uniref:Acetylserotonin O-methyltransferase n=1 Tax=Leptobrachium leishanense TaxID=445787 RepID=A0A8C5P9D7_9ANUR
MHKPVVILLLNSVDILHGMSLLYSLFMNIFDVLAKSKVPLSSKAVAEALGASVRGTQCLLDACVGLKLLETDFQNGEVFYKNTKLSRCYLTKTSSKSMFSTLMFFSSEVYPCIYESEDSILRFMQCMDSYFFLFGKKEIISSFDLSCFKTICDLGGCTGRVAKTCGSLYPESTIIVYDLPKIIQVACEHFTGEKDSKISFQQGNFFEDPIPDADLFILSHILHDWDDETCLKLLKKVYMACNPGGGIFIIEAVLNKTEEGPAIIHLQNVVMLMICEGKERTATEFKTLLVTAGFKDIQFSTKGIITNGILARK